MSFNHKLENGIGEVVEKTGLSVEVQEMIAHEGERLLDVFSQFGDNQETVTAGIASLSALAAKQPSAEAEKGI